jgi:polyphosphate kinase
MGEATISTTLSDDRERRIAEESAEVVEELSERPRRREPSSLPPDRFLDRELSWLAFNERVLELAEDRRVPLLERLRYAGIFAMNLDEFFMVRVAGLRRRIAAGLDAAPVDGVSAHESLAAVAARSQALMSRHAAQFAGELRPGLAAEGIELLAWADLTDGEQSKMHDLFEEQVYPVLTPLAVDPAHPFPYISGLSLNLAVIARDPAEGRERFARVKVPPSLARFLRVGDGERFVPLEEVIEAHLPSLFPGVDVLEACAFRVTRNEDLEVGDEDGDNLLVALERELARRRFGAAVRLELEDRASDHVLDLLVRELGMGAEAVYRLPGPLDLADVMALADLSHPQLAYPSFVPATPAALQRDPEELFAAIEEGEVLVHHPYDSFTTTVQELIEQASVDPRVLAIKQTLYRTSGDSPVVDALVDAARSGKQVLVIVEIKARFDERANIRWARKLEQAGCNVVYGLVGLKTHCKVALVVRQEPGGKLRRYAHIGTGNYNPKTARVYEDIGLLTADPEICADVADLFNHLSGHTRHLDYERLLVAPETLRDGRPRRQSFRHHHEAQQPGRRRGDRRSLRRVAGRRPDRPGRPKSVLAPARGAGALGADPGPQHRRSLPRALPHPALSCRRRRRALDR